MKEIKKEDDSAYKHHAQSDLIIQLYSSTDELKSVFPAAGGGEVVEEEEVAEVEEQEQQEEVEEDPAAQLRA